MACEEHFHQELRRLGRRLTPQRELVLSALHEAEAPLLAEELYEALLARTAGPNDAQMDLSTVYRTLNLLAELELVASVVTDDGRHRYELLGVHGGHLHLACQRCGRVEGLALTEAQAFVAQLETQFGFAADVSQLVIPGLCRNCRAMGVLSQHGAANSPELVPTGGS